MKNKLFLCFRPVFIETEDNKPNVIQCSDDGFCTFAPASKELKIKLSGSNNETRRISDNHPRKRDSRRSFSRILKAVFFEVSMSKRVQEGKIRQLTFESYTSYSKKSTSDGKSENRKSPETDVEPRRTSLLVSSSSCSFSSCSSSSTSEQSISKKGSFSNCEPNSFDKKKQSSKEDKTIDSSSAPNSRLHLIIIITLFVTIFWGKLCAMVFTSVWLYFLRRRHVLERLSENMAKSPVKEAVGKYKNRVIKKEMHERNH